MRNEIQALRAFAILVVVGYHAWPLVVTGGFVGVDVFFVISGFLISDHILTQVRAGTFTLTGFYARRIRRIFPAALLVLLVCLAGIVAFSSLLDWQNFSSQTAASASFIENWFLGALSVDYLGADANPSPVQHYWSLSVEEQFYLLWPLVLVVATHSFARIRPTSPATPSGANPGLPVGLIFTVAIIAVLSLAFSSLSTATDPVAGFFNTFGRVWEFALGTLLAIFLRSGRIPVLLRIGLAVTGWAALVATVAFFTDSVAFPGLMALIPTLATVLIIAAGSPTAVNTARAVRVIYGNRLVLLIGEISFAAYLWHWPLLIFTRQILGSEIPNWMLGLLVIAAFGLAWASTRYIENPIRFSPRIKNSRAVIVAGLASALAVVLVALIPVVAIERIESTAGESSLAGVGAKTPQPTQSTSVGESGRLCVGAEARLAESTCIDGPYPVIVPDILAGRGAISNLQTSSPKCAATKGDTQIFTCVFGNPQSAKRVVLVGDSKAMKMFPAIEELAVEFDWSLTVYLRGACAWHVPDGSGTPCDAFRSEVTTQLHEGDWDAVFVASAASNTQSPEKYRRLWQPVLDAATPIIVIRDNPNFETDPRECILNLTSLAEIDSCAGERTSVLSDDRQASTAAVTPGVHLLDFSEIYCNSSTCPVMIGGIFVYRDKGHVNDEFTRTLAPIIRDRLGVKLQNLFTTSE